ncbi:ABC transporter permease [Spirochaetia bacterium]|nr:ABC transporter permease [Spirochaetia bacterium]
MIPCFPDFVPVSLDIKDELQGKLSTAPDGVSEFTFAGLYLFRGHYQYRVSQTPAGGAPIISGIQPGRGTFFLTPCAFPGKEILTGLFDTHDYWKNIPESVLEPNRETLAQLGVDITGDRDNFDYLYLRTDLAELAGKKYHKKRNLVNQFLSAYDHQEWPLTTDLLPEALGVLDRWRADKGSEGDYVAAQEALALFRPLGLEGQLYFINGKPAGWCLGESLAQGKMFAVHFEKGIGEYKGIYQFMNQAFAASLPEYYTHINREQDLGDEGLRQAKETYRPSGFVKKYVGKIRGV